MENIAYNAQNTALNRTLQMIDINNHKSFQVARLHHKQRRAEELIQRNKEIALLRKKIILNVLQRVIGLVLIVGIILFCSSDLAYVEEAGGNDWTGAFVLIPIGLFALLSKKCWLFK